MDDAEDFTQLDDPEFLAERRRVGAMVERTPTDEQSPELIARYRRLNDEFLRRASAAWALASKGVLPVNATAEISALPAKAARMLAVEILLADPEALADDVLESCLYILRERLRAQ